MSSLLLIFLTFTVPAAPRECETNLLGVIESRANIDWSGNSNYDFNDIARTLVTFAPQTSNGPATDETRLFVEIPYYYLHPTNGVYAMIRCTDADNNHCWQRTIYKATISSWKQVY